MVQVDFAVIGGGPAGITAALRARELGARVALLERGALGGTCTNDGCAPTRVLARSARLIRDAEQFGAYGLIGGVPQVDFGAVMNNVQRIIGALHEKKQLQERLTHSDITLIDNAGAARFEDPHTLVTERGKRVEADKILICVGGHPRRLDIPGGEHVMTHSDVWGLRELPRRVAIIGSAATGCQMASVFEAFGSQVHLFELAPRVLPGEDPEVSAAIAAAFTARGVQLTTGIKGVNRVERGANGLTVHYTAGDAEQQVEVDAVMASVGWPGNSGGLNLEAAGVRVERSYVVVDDTLRTSVEHIYAAGDITGRMMLVQSATHEARLAAQNAVLGRRRAETHTLVPHGGFTDPEYAGVGLTEPRAREQHEIAVSTVPYADLDRAVIDGRTEGFCKLIVSRETHQVLGAHVVGEQAVEIVQIVAAAMAGNTAIEQLAQLELAYPTFAAVVGLAARDLTRQLGNVTVATEWGALPKVTEWESAGGAMTR